MRNGKKNSSCAATQIGYNSVGNITATSVKALAFTMGTNNFNLTSAVLRLECGTVPNANCSDLQSISLGVFSNGASQPGSLLGSFTYAFSLPLTTSWAGVLGINGTENRVKVTRVMQP